MNDPQKKSLRLLSLHHLFHERSQGYKVNQLSERLGVSERTIERDLLDLQALPYNLPLNKDGWYWRLDRTVAIPLPPVTLTREQATALFIGARLLSQHSGRLAAFSEAAIEKLAMSLPAEVGSLLLVETQRVAGTNDRPEKAKLTETVFAAFVAGWLERRKVLCRHRTLAGKISTYTLAPHTWEPSAVGYAIYIIGQCNEDPPGKLRTLKLDRVEEASLTDEPFLIPPSDAQRPLRNAWRIWDSGTAPVEVRLRFSARVASRVVESVWHPTQEILPLEGGSCEWKATVSETQEMLPWIRGWGSECEVLAPSSLRSSLIRETRKLARLYNLEEPELATSIPAPENVCEESESNRLRDTFRDFFGG